MRRYKFLPKVKIFEALNRLRSSFLAAKDGEEVNNIIKAVLTTDEQIKIGRRIMIAQLLMDGKTFLEICQELKVGKGTVVKVSNSLEKYPKSFQLVNKHAKRSQIDIDRSLYEKEGGPKLVFKRGVFKGVELKNIKR